MARDYETHRTHQGQLTGAAISPNMSILSNGSATPMSRLIGSVVTMKPVKSWISRLVGRPEVHFSRCEMTSETVTPSLQYSRRSAAHG
jgi:hypothetical protein